MNRVVGSLIIVASIGLPMQLGMNLLAFIDIPALIIVLGVGIGVIMVRHGNGAVAKLFNSEDNLEVVNSLFLAVCCAAIFANLISMVVLLAQLGDVKVVGPAIAVAVLSTVYMVLVVIACLTLNRKFTIDSGKALLILAPVMMSSIFYTGALNITL